MKKLIILFLFCSISLLAQSLELNKENSNVFYKATKSQFFMEFNILGINKNIKGDIEKNQFGYEGILYIDSSKFDSDNSIRDSHVREDYLKSDDFSYIRFDYTIEDNTAKGIMLISGVPKQIEFPVQINETNNNLNITGEIKIKYSDFAIKTPSNLILSADDNLIIGANLNFDK